MNEKNASRKLPLSKLIFDVYIHCSKAMNEICNNPRILFPLIISILTPLLFYSISIKAYIPFLSVLQDVEDLDKVRDMVPIGVGINVLQNVIMWIIRAGLLFILIKCFRLKGSFKQVLSITGFAYLAIVPMMIIMCIAGFFTGDLFVNFSVAVFFKSLQGTYLYGFLRGLCLFFTWEHIIIAIGLYELTKSKKTILFVVLLYFLQILLNIQNLKIM